MRRTREGCNRSTALICGALRTPGYTFRGGLRRGRGRACEGTHLGSLPQEILVLQPQSLLLHLQLLEPHLVAAPHDLGAGGDGRGLLDRGALADPLLVQGWGRGKKRKKRGRRHSPSRHRRAHERPEHTLTLRPN